MWSRFRALRVDWCGRKRLPQFKRELSTILYVAHRSGSVCARRTIGVRCGQCTARVGVALLLKKAHCSGALVREWGAGIDERICCGLCGSEVRMWIAGRCFVKACEPMTTSNGLCERASSVPSALTVIRTAQGERPTLYPKSASPAAFATAGIRLRVSRYGVYEEYLDLSGRVLVVSARCRRLAPMLHRSLRLQFAGQKLTCECNEKTVFPEPGWQAPANGTDLK